MEIDNSLMENLIGQWRSSTGLVFLTICFAVALLRIFRYNKLFLLKNGDRIFFYFLLICSLIFFLAVIFLNILTLVSPNGPITQTGFSLGAVCLLGCLLILTIVSQRFKSTIGFGAVGPATAQKFDLLNGEEPKWIKWIMKVSFSYILICGIPLVYLGFLHWPEVAAHKTNYALHAFRFFTAFLILLNLWNVKGVLLALSGKDDFSKNRIKMSR